MTQIFKARIIFFLKIFISIFLIWIVFRKVDLEVLARHLLAANKLIFTFAFLVFLISFLIGCMRWGVLIRKFGEFTDLEIIRLSFIGLFYNVFVPGGVAGDVIKGIKTKDVGATNSAASIILDRVIGLLSFITFLFIGLLVGHKLFIETYVWRLLLAICIAAYLLFLLLMSRNTFKQLNRLVAKSAHRFSRILLPFHHFSLDRARISKSFILSMVSSFLNIIVIMLLARSLDVHISFFAHMTFIPAIIISSLMPLSFRGAGVRELLFVYFYGSQGVSPEKCLAVSAIYFILNMILASIGWLVEAFAKNVSASAN